MAKKPLKKEEARTRGHLVLTLELNLGMNTDTLQKLLDFLSASTPRDDEDTPFLLQELKTLNLTFLDIRDAYKRSETARQGLIQEERETSRRTYSGGRPQTGEARVALDLGHDRWWKHRVTVERVPPEHVHLVEKWRAFADFARNLEECKAESGTLICFECEHDNPVGQTQCQECGAWVPQTAKARWAYRKDSEL